MKFSDEQDKKSMKSSYLADHKLPNCSVNIVKIFAHIVIILLHQIENFKQIGRRMNEIQQTISSIQVFRQTNDVLIQYKIISWHIYRSFMF